MKNTNDAIYEIMKTALDSDDAQMLYSCGNKGSEKEVYTIENLMHAIRIGALKSTNLLVKTHHINYESKIQALTFATQTDQKEIIEVFNEARIFLTSEQN